MSKWIDLDTIFRKTLQERFESGSSKIKNLADALDIIIEEIGEFLKNTDNFDRPVCFMDNKIIEAILDSYQKKFRDIIDSFNTGNSFETYHKLCDLIKNDLDDFVVKLKVSTTLYRMRSSDEYINFKRKDIFHNPFNKLETISKQRYSIDGFPCLYLGSSLYDCWMETRRPDIWKVHFAAFKNQSEIYFFNVDYPLLIAKENHFLQLILCCLCSIKVNDDKKKHKFEYVFPELLLHSIISIMNDPTTKCAHKINGIRYLSSFFNDKNDFYCNKQILYNYVVPVQKVITTDEFCPLLKNLFKVSEVTALYKYKLESFGFSKNRSRTNLYDNSLFKQIEGDLKIFKFATDD